MMSRVRCLLRPLCACALAVLLAACSREQPPTGTVRVETDDAVVNAAMLTHSYTWDGVASDPVAPTDLEDDDVPRHRRRRHGRGAHVLLAARYRNRGRALSR